MDVKGQTLINKEVFCQNNELLTLKRRFKVVKKGQQSSNGVPTGPGSSLTGVSNLNGSEGHIPKKKRLKKCILGKTGSVKKLLERL
jgi:hypothetical protein